VTARNPNYRLAKIHRSYSVDEVARLFGTHRNTVRSWIRGGLRTIDAIRPHVIAGIDLRDFLHKRRQASKRPCEPGEIYCMRCRAPRRPAQGRVDYHPLTATAGNLIGLCSVCSARMDRRSNLVQLHSIGRELAIRMPVAQEHIAKSPSPSLNCDSD